MSKVKVGQVYESTDPRDIPPRRLHVVRGSVLKNGFRPAEQAWIVRNEKTGKLTRISERLLLKSGSRGYRLVQEAPDADPAGE